MMPAVSGNMPIPHKAMDAKIKHTVPAWPTNRASRNFLRPSANIKLNTPQKIKLELNKTAAAPLS